ncbi:MAG: hypothetical protein ACLPJJ_05550, partial [Acidocella sp.]|uniref:hypothetical protein n=1 Tax=Acidocella sp. TaxID=50710 RepID=UPI003FD87600
NKMNPHTVQHIATVTTLRGGVGPGRSFTLATTVFFKSQPVRPAFLGKKRIWPSYFLKVST